VETVALQLACLKLDGPVLEEEKSQEIYALKFVVEVGILEIMLVMMETI